jgi:polysaccharide deacetylase family protein (PEP-CTERM system associated)
MHALTVDVEEWYHPLRFYCSTERFTASRLNVGMDRLLGLLDGAGTKATFFWVAELAKNHKSLIAALVAAGHEIACHGLKHDKMVYDQTPSQFRSETAAALGILRALSGCEVLGYRAPCFSITARTPWAADILSELGIAYDSSVFPIYNWRYGNAKAPVNPHLVGTRRQLWEFPIGSRRVVGLNIPVSGGAYLRIYPYWLSSANIRHCEAQRRSIVFYVHPWELDPEHPYVRFHWKARITHYVNLRSTYSRLSRLLSEFKFFPLRSLLRNVGRSEQRDS